MTAGSAFTPRWSVLAAFYSALTIVYAWPLLPVLGAALPNDIIDPGLITWGLWWNAHALPLTDQWWNAPMFFPLPGVFALSESFLGLAPLSTPLQWIGVSPVATYNAIFLLSFPASALAAHALARRLTGRHDVALIAGLATGFNPFRASQMPHLHLLAVWWMPLGLLALHQYLDNRRWRPLVLFGVCWLMNALTSGYFLIFYAVVVGGWMVWFLRTRREWLMIAAVLAAASAPLAPVILGYGHHQRVLGLSRTASEIEAFSADLQAYWTVSRFLWVPRHWSFPSRAEGELYPGALVLLTVIGGSIWLWRRRSHRLSRPQLAVFGAAGIAVLAGAATALGGPGMRLQVPRLGAIEPHHWLTPATWLFIVGLCLDRRVADAWRRRSTLAFFVTMSAALMLLSLGPIARVTDVPFLYGAPYGWLAALPGGDSIRVPARFGILAILCLVQATALLLARLFPAGMRLPVLAVVAVAVLADGWVPQLLAVPVKRSINVASLAPPDAAVLELPMREPVDDAAAILNGTQHRRPVVNGYSGYGPPHYGIVQRGIRSGDASVIEALRTFAPLVVIVDKEADGNGTYAEFVATARDARRVAATGRGTVFTFPKLTRPAAAASQAIAITAADANLARVDAGRMIDGRVETEWTSERLQLPGMEVSFTFAPADVIRIEMDLGEGTRNYPRGLRLQIEDERGATHPIWEGGTAGAALLGALADWRRTTIAIDLPAAVRGRRVIATLTERDGYDPWKIAEFRLFSPK